MKSKRKIIDSISILVYLVTIVVVSNCITYHFLFKKDMESIRYHNYLMEEYINSNRETNKCTIDNIDLAKPSTSNKELGVFTLSFYTPKELGASSPEQLRTATGTVPIEGRTIATDPRVIPKGSIVYIDGWGYYKAEDTGSAIKGKRIDIFLNDYDRAIKLGNKKKAKVYLL